LHIFRYLGYFVIKVGQSYELRDRSRWPCGRLIAEIVGSNPAGGIMFVSCVCCVVTSLSFFEKNLTVCVCVFMIQKPRQ